MHDVYHDESKEAGYWHGILLVPRATRPVILQHLAIIRREAGCNLPLSLKDVKSRGNRFQCSRAAVQLAVAAMMQDAKGQAVSVVVSARSYDQQERRTATNYREIVRITEPLKMRFIVFRERDCLKFLDPEGHFLDYGAKVETTFRMGFKGGLHLLFDEDDPVMIASFHFDGHEHHQRHADADRIVGRLADGLRPYCRIVEPPVMDDRSSDHRQPGAQSYDDCQFLQLTDLLIGSFRAVLGECKNDVQADVAYPVAGLVDKWKAGRKRMENCRWYRGFCSSQCHLENGKWQFTPLPAKENPDQTCFQF